MAKKTKKTKITETIVTQLQEPVVIQEEKQEELTPAVEIPVEDPKPVIMEEPIQKEPEPEQPESKSPASIITDSETAGINLSLWGVL